MKDLDQKIQERFIALLNLAVSIENNRKWLPITETYAHPNSEDYKNFRTRALNLIRIVCGEHSDHYKELDRLAQNSASAYNSYYLQDCVGIVKAAQSDFEHGMLTEIRDLIRGEVFGDFLEQAENLIKEDYYHAGVMLAGAVLEDTLRKMCVKFEVELPVKTTINVLNDALYKAKKIDGFTQKLVGTLAHLRNEAAHGHFDKIKKDDAEDMVKRVRRFAADHLTQ